VLHPLAAGISVEIDAGIDGPIHCGDI
jgi:hypothetical protein